MYGEIHLVNLNPYYNNEVFYRTELSADVRLDYIRNNFSCIVTNEDVDVHDVMDMKVVKVTVDFSVEDLT